MAVHRGRIDLLERHLAGDEHLLTRTFSHDAIWPPSIGCSTDPGHAAHGTPLDGATLLHLCVDYDEIEVARWLLERGMPADAPARLDADGFGGHTALFGCVVSFPYRMGIREDDLFARLLLDHGANPNARASLRKLLRDVGDETMHEYIDITPLGWGARFHEQEFVSQTAMRLIAERGGHH
jgi:ankyrin repeat protein